MHKLDATCLIFAVASVVVQALFKCTLYRRYSTGEGLARVTIWWAEAAYSMLRRKLGSDYFF